MINKAIREIISIITDDSKYLEMVNKPIFNDNQLNRDKSDIANDIKLIIS